MARSSWFTGFLRHLHFNDFVFCLFRLWQPDFEHAILEGSIHLVGFHIHGKFDGPRERAEGPFATVIVLLLDLLFLFLFAPDGQGRAVEANVNFIFG